MIAPGNACTFDSDPAQPSITSGTMDIALTKAYAPVFLVEFAGAPEGGADSLVGLEVRITKEDGAPLAS
jgi:hypothetical protein